MPDGAKQGQGAHACDRTVEKHATCGEMKIMFRIVGMGCLWEAEEALKGTLTAQGVPKGGLVTSETGSTGYMTDAPLSNGDVGNADVDLGHTRDTRDPQPAHRARGYGAG